MTFKILQNYNNLVFKQLKFNSTVINKVYYFYYYVWAGLRRNFFWHFTF